MVEERKHKKPRGKAELIEGKCIACGARCESSCPSDAIEMNENGEPIIDLEKCIGCRKCVKVCPFDAITLKNNLAYIDFEKCKLCRKCVPECPTNAIHEINFPPRKPRPEKQAEAPKEPAPEEAKS